jgi:hypothetical protein
MQRAETLGWIIDQLSLAAVAKGQVFSEERLRINAEDLIDIPQTALQEAFARARRELDYAPGVAELRRLALADRQLRIHAEMRLAWDLLVTYVGKWGRWGEDYKFAFIEKGAPPLMPKIADSVRRTGGWAAYLNLQYDTDAHARDAAFQQKRFFDEYQNWEAVELIAPAFALPATPEVKQIAAGKTMETRRPAAAAQPRAAPVPPVARAGRTSEMTEQEVADRRMILRQQAETIAQQRKASEAIVSEVKV